MSTPYCIIAIKYCTSARADEIGCIQGHKWVMTVSVVLPCLGKYRLEVTALYVNISLQNTTWITVYTGSRANVFVLLAWMGYRRVLASVATQSGCLFPPS